MPSKALIDGDILCYRSGFAAEHSHYLLVDREQGVPVKEFESYADFRAYTKEFPDWEQQYDMESYRTVEDVSHALANVKSTVAKILDKTDCNEYVVFLSSGDNFRNDIATIQGYKANRKDARKPEHYEAIWDYLTTYYGAITLKSIESDDALAMCQTKDTVICSIDKDLLQVPGFHYDWVGDYKTLVSPDVGLRKLYQQVLTGDSTDNIPGIRGIGPVKARKIITDTYELIGRDEHELHQVCCVHWNKFLETDPFDGHYESATGLLYYPHWSDEHKDMVAKTAADIVNEVRALLTVGGKEAYAALQKSGEEIPLPSEEERKEVRTSRPLSLVA